MGLDGMRLDLDWIGLDVAPVFRAFAHHVIPLLSSLAKHLYLLLSCFDYL